jgi:beta-phosphoglucomutase
MIKLIIFDLDGVLIEAKHLHYEALNDALNLHA